MDCLEAFQGMVVAMDETAVPARSEESIREVMRTETREKNKGGRPRKVYGPPAPVDTGDATEAEIRHALKHA